MTKSQFKLVGSDICPFVQRIRFLLEIKSISYEVEFIDLLQKPEWFLRVAPLAQVPVLIHDNVAIFGSDVILSYLDDLTGNELYSAEVLLRAREKTLIEVSSKALISQWDMCLAKDQIEYDKAKNELLARLTWIEKELSCLQQIEESAVSMMDIALAPLLQRLKIVGHQLGTEYFHNAPFLTASFKKATESEAYLKSADDDLSNRIFRKVINSGGVFTIPVINP